MRYWVLLSLALSACAPVVVQQPNVIRCETPSACDYLAQAMREACGGTPVITHRGVKAHLNSRMFSVYFYCRK